MGEGTLINKERISDSQYAVLLFLTIMTTAVLYVPSITAKEAKQSAWLVPALASGAGFLTLWLVWKLGRRFPGQSLLQYSSIILGKFIGKMLGVGYILFFIVVNVLTLRQFTEAINISLLENTPIWFVGFLLAMLCSYGAFLGIEVIARAAQFVLPLFVINVIGVIFFALQDLDFNQLFPILEGGVGPILKASYIPASWFGECIILALLFPHINKPKEIFRKSSWAIIATIILFSGDILLALLVLGPDLAASFDLSFWKVIRFIEVGSTFLRVETIFIFLWISIITVKFSLMLFLGSTTIAEVLGWKSYKAVVFPYGLVVVIVSSFFIKDAIQLGKLLSIYWPTIALFFEVFIPGLLLVVAGVLKKGRKRGEKNPS